jgi:pyridoxal biosynthesis lyase PdxS
VLTPADDIHHINKHNFKVPFVCGCRDLGEALRRIAEGAAMIRTKVGTRRTSEVGAAHVTYSGPLSTVGWSCVTVHAAVSPG